MTPFRIPQRALEQMGLQVVEWPPESDRVAYYDRYEVGEVAAMCRQAIATDHRDGCSCGGYLAFDLECPRGQAMNGVAWVHEVKVEMEAKLVPNDGEPVRWPEPEYIQEAIL